MMAIPVVIGALGTVPKGLEKSFEDLEIRGKDRNHTDCCYIIQESPRDLIELAVPLTPVKKVRSSKLMIIITIIITIPGDLRRLADSQTPVKNHQQTLM